MFSFIFSGLEEKPCVYTWCIVNQILLLYIYRKKYFSSCVSCILMPSSSACLTVNRCTGTNRVFHFFVEKGLCVLAFRVSQIVDRQGEKEAQPGCVIFRLPSFAQLIPEWHELLFPVFSVFIFRIHRISPDLYGIFFRTVTRQGSHPDRILHATWVAIRYAPQDDNNSIDCVMSIGEETSAVKVPCSVNNPMPYVHNCSFTCVYLYDYAVHPLRSSPSLYGKL